MGKVATQTKENMIALGIYRQEFDMTIEIYAGLVEQYKVLQRQFKRSKYEVTEKTGYSDNSKKSPLVAAMENLRKDILSYSNALGLTPSGLKKIKDKSENVSNKEPSALEKVLMSID